MGSGQESTENTSAEAMRSFWDAKARENAMWFIHSQLDYVNPDEAEFWRSGEQNLDQTLNPFGASIQGTDCVLEIGCGIGRITRAIAQRARSVTALDVSPEMIARGREALRDLATVEFVRGNGRNLEGLDENTFDVVYSFIVFQHIPDPEVTCAYVRDIGRVLRPGGWTVFQVSERPEIHNAAHWRSAETPRTRLARMLGRRPTGTLEPEWLGSAVTRSALLEALAVGGLRLEATVGDGTQFCLVHATRPSDD